MAEAWLRASRISASRISGCTRCDFSVVSGLKTAMKLFGQAFDRSGFELGCRLSTGA